MATEKILLSLMSRGYCHLCHDMEAALVPLAAEFGADIEVLDVDMDPALEAKYDELVPVLLTGRPDSAITSWMRPKSMMNPQVQIDAVAHGVHGTILLFDNRRMAAISSLQEAQYGVNWRTHDGVEVDYLALGRAVRGVADFGGGASPEDLIKALSRAQAHPGLSLVHVPVYFGPDPAGGMGSFGQWNVGNWCTAVQARYAETLI